MSQCPHCRGLRKSRASHVKCECGDKPHTKADCAHPEKGDSKSELGRINIDVVQFLILAQWITMSAVAATEPVAPVP